MSSPPPPVFVYGTLTDPETVDGLLGSWRFDGDAVLEGLQRVEGRYPTLVPGGRADGRLLVTPDLGTLDTYEGVDRGLYVRVDVPIVGGGRAWLYVGDPARLDAPTRWPGAGPFDARVRAHLDAADVRIRRVGNR